MPAAAVYVAAAVAGVAAAIAFKEFVYDPHLAPKFEQWVDELKENHRRAVARRRHRLEQRRVVGVPVRLRDESDDDEGPGHLDSEMLERKQRPSSIELQTLVEQEVQSWREDTVHPGLRRRQPGHGSVHDEPSAMLVSPMSPAASSSATLPAGSAQLLAIAASSRSSAQSPSVHTGTILHTPIPRVASPAVSERSSTLFSVSSRTSTPEIRSSQAPLASLSVLTDVRSPPSRTLSPFSDLGAGTGAMSSRPDPASPSSIGSPFMSPGEDPMSPFSEYLSLEAASAAPIAPSTSANATVQAIRSPTLGFESDDDMFSIASPSVSVNELASIHGENDVLGDDTDIEELFSDIGSVHGSELSGWASIGSPRQ